MVKIVNFFIIHVLMTMVFGPIDELSVINELSVIITS